MGFFGMFVLMIVVVFVVTVIVTLYNKNQKKGANEKLIEIEIPRMEKWIPDGFVDSDVLQLIDEAKLNGQAFIKIKKGKYDDIVAKSLKKLFAKSDAEKASELVKCPKCRSTQITSAQSGFSAGKAVAGAFLAGGVGLLLGGFHGSKDLVVYCMKCGHKWKPSNIK